MIFEVGPDGFDGVVRIAPDEFLVLFAPFESWGAISHSAVIRRIRTGILRKAAFSYTLKSPGSSEVSWSTGDLSSRDLVARMIHDNLLHNEGRTCWVEF